MSAGEFNYLTLENGEDKKEPLIDEKNIHNDSTFLLQEDNSVKKSGTKMILYIETPQIMYHHIKK